MANPNRVAILCMHSSPIAKLGGVDVGGMNLYVRHLADDLSLAGLSVDVFTRRTDRETPEIVVRESGARVVHLAAGAARRLPKSVLPLHLPAMVSAMRIFTSKHALDYDLLHSHYWLSGLAAMRYRARCGPRIPIVHMFHTLSLVKDTYLGEPDPTDSALRQDGERCVISRADAIVGSTEAEAHEMARLYGRAPREYAVIPPGVDVHMFLPLGMERSREKLGIDAKRMILFVGRQDRMKGLGLLLRSVAQLPEDQRRDLKLVLVGGHETRGAEAATRNALLRKLGLENNVVVRGKVSQAELPLYYSAADICAVPSAYESFGMAAIESMACQTPVVAFAVGGLAATIRDGHTGFLARAGDSHEYTLKLSTALAFPQLDAVGRRARMSVQRYTWEAATRRTLGLYSRVM